RANSECLCAWNAGVVPRTSLSCRRPPLPPRPASARGRRGTTHIQERTMASIETFNDHCWHDVIPEADIELYANWRRDTFVGPRPALLAIDLYDLVYRGGRHSPYDLNERYPNSCG